MESDALFVFRYDRTFEGLLTVVFDAYSRKSFPERLIGPGEPVPMFAREVLELHDRSGPGGAGYGRGCGRQICPGVFATCSSTSGCPSP